MNNTLIFIDQYFKEELVPSEKEQFERRCLSDPAFAQMVAFYISLHDQLKEQWKQQKKEEFALLEESDPAAADLAVSRMGNGPDAAAPFAGNRSGDHDPRSGEGAVREVRAISDARDAPVTQPRKGKVVQMALWKKLAVAAAVLGLVILGVSRLMRPEDEAPAVATTGSKTDSTPGTAAGTGVPAPATLPATPDTAAVATRQSNRVPKAQPKKVEPGRLYARNFVPDEVPAETGELLAAALDQYEQRSYASARRELESAIGIAGNLTTRASGDLQEEAERKRILFYARYYYGICYLAEGKAEQAISQLSALKESPDGRWQSKVNWYLALAYLKAGKVRKAKSLLRMVAGSSEAGPLRQKAKKLASELNGSSLK